MSLCDREAYIYPVGTYIMRNIPEYNCSILHCYFCVGVFGGKYSFITNLKISVAKNNKNQEENVNFIYHHPNFQIFVSVFLSTVPAFIDNVTVFLDRKLTFITIFTAREHQVF